MLIVYIHGHGASHQSFNFIRSQLGEHDYINISYSSDDGFSNNLKAMSEKLLQVSDNIIFIGHSLGGLYALHLSDVAGLREKTIGIITLATPFGGSEAAVVLNVMWPQQLYKDISPYSDPVRKGKRIVLSCPLTAIVTTKGHAQMMSACNDGIVTRDSMKSREGAIFIDVAATHHEVVLNTKAVEIIKDAIKSLSRNM